MFLIAMRVLDWTLVSQPLQRLPSPTSKSVSSPYVNALDLVWNIRGVGWSFSSPSSIPLHPHAREGRLAFALRTLLYGLLALTIYDGTHHGVQLMGPTTFGHPRGGSIFDPSLPPLPRYMRSLFVTFVSGLVLYFSLDAMYSVMTLFGVGLMGMSPERWPPFSRPPWKATSIREFWGRAWHQTFRRSFCTLGSIPFSKVLGPAGVPLGAFAVSALMHDMILWGMGRGIDGWKVHGFFWAMGVGCILERGFEKASGRRVGGPAGWLWTMAWTIGWGQLMLEGYLGKGLGGSQILPEGWRPGKAIIEIVRERL
jgi:hypothetical protein